VLGSVASDGLEGSVVSAEGNVESDNGLAGLDEVEELGVDAGLGSGLVEEELDLLEETGLLELVELGAEASLCGGGRESGGLC